MGKLFIFHITAYVPANDRTKDEIEDIILEGLDNVGTRVSSWKIDEEEEEDEEEK